MTAATTSTSTSSTSSIIATTSSPTSSTTSSTSITALHLHHLHHRPHRPPPVQVVQLQQQMEGKNPAFIKLAEEVKHVQARVPPARIALSSLATCSTCPTRSRAPSPRTASLRATAASAPP